MRKIFYSLLIIFVLSACSQEETEDEVLSTKDVEIPSTIFTSEKSSRVIDEKEMKQSITLYLDSSAVLDDAREPFLEIIYDSDKKLTKSEFEKYNRINQLLVENDENFSHYISNNTLPEGYQESSKKISDYITAVNQYLYELDEKLDNFDEKLDKIIDNASEGNLSEIGTIKGTVKDTIKDKSNIVNGREQKKIEAFLDEKNIQTIAFDRDKKK